MALAEDDIPETPWPNVLRGAEIRETITWCLDEGRYTVHPHCKREMRKDNIVPQELEVVLEDGKMVPRSRDRQNPEWKKDSKPPEFSYRIALQVDERIVGVAIRFREYQDLPYMVPYTCWANDMN